MSHTLLQSRGRQLLRRSWDRAARAATTSAYFDLQRGAGGHVKLEASVAGMAALRLPQLNKGAAFTHQERKELGLTGLLPPAVRTMKEQLERCYRAYVTQRSPLEKYQYLRSLQERNEHLYFAFVAAHLPEVLPIVSTPTVGEACMNYSYLYNYPRGLSLSVNNIDDAEAIMRDFHLKDVRMVVVTDSSAILGTGDQGYGGIGVPIGKLAIYTAAAGVCPFNTCPVALDVGTNRMDLLHDPMYLGVKMHRLTGNAYMAFMEKFVSAVKKVWPKALIQWEDFSKDVAFGVLNRFRDEICSFNDAIQGTGAVAVAGVLTACRKIGKQLSDQHFVISGAGAGGCGVAAALREALRREGLSSEEARARVLVLDSAGLLFVGRKGIEDYKEPAAQVEAVARAIPSQTGVPSLLETVVGSKCTCLIGLSSRPGQFTEPVIRAVAANTPTPIIMPLSNPPPSSEASPVDIVEWTYNTAWVASGSHSGEVRVLYGPPVPIGHGTNAFIFPGLGAGAAAVGATRVTDNMVMEAAYTLADFCCQHWPEAKRVYPPVSEMPKVGREVARRVALQAVKDGVAADVPLDEAEQKVLERVDAAFWAPVYPEIVRKH